MITNEQIYEKLEAIENYLKVIVRAKQPGKVKSLEWELRDRKRMTTRDVMAFFGGCARNWALDRMRKLSGESKFTRFVPGDPRFRRPSLIIYNEEKGKESLMYRLKIIAENNDEISLSEITVSMSLEISSDLFLVKELVEEFVSKNEGYEFVNGNKLRKLPVRVSGNS